MLGVVIGDAFGAAFEGNECVEPDELAEFVGGRGSLRYTDDTHMTLGLAQSLVERRGFDATHAAEVFARNFEAEPWRGYGPGPPQIFRMIRKGVPWDEAARRLFGGAGSFGNGAAMRTVPVALLAWRDLGRLARLAADSARITHAHEWGMDGAVLQACAIALLLQRDPGRALDRSALLQELAGLVRTPRFREILARLRSLPADLEPHQAAAELGHGIEAARSVPTALHAFLRHPDSFTDVVQYAIQLGGDTDTIASMAGAMAGAYLGEAAIPAAWRERVEGVEELARLGRELFQLAQEQAE